MLKCLRVQVELEKLKLSELSCVEALSAIARIIYSVHDDVKDKDFELELRCHVSIRNLSSHGNDYRCHHFPVGFAKSQDGSIKGSRIISDRRQPTMPKPRLRKQAMTSRHWSDVACYVSGWCSLLWQVKQLDRDDSWQVRSLLHFRTEPFIHTVVQLASRCENEIKPFICAVQLISTKSRLPLLAAASWFGCSAWNCF